MTYQTLLHELAPDLNPAGVEASMRLLYGTLNHLPRETFVAEAKLAADLEGHPIAPESQDFDLTVRRALYGKATRWRIYYAAIDGAVKILHVRHGRRSDWQP